MQKNELGPNGEYRSGAFTAQAPAVDKIKVNTKNGAAPIGDGALLWGTIVFWHIDSDESKD